jgi:hypothetical protein
LARMIRRGFDSANLALLVDELGKQGIEIVDRLMTDGIQRNPATEVARLAKQVGAMDDVHKLVTSGNLENPNGLLRFMRRAAADPNLLAQLREAAQRSAGGRVALEKSLSPKGEADVIDHARQEALQIKEVGTPGGTDPGGNYVSRVADYVNDAAGQLRGERGEMPPSGYKTIVDVRIVGRSNKLFPLDRAQLLQTLRGEGVTQSSLRGVAEVRVTNGTGQHTFNPSEF